MSRPCPRCQRVLDLPGPAAFCPYCGQALGAATPSPVATAPAEVRRAEAETLAPPTVPPFHDPDATAPTPGSWPASGIERLGEYRLVRWLGQGGMGVVFEGEHQPTKRRVAVKLVDVQASDDAITRFRQEGKLASAISHPRCVFVYAADQDAGRPFIVLELMPGRTLEDVVRERGPLPVEQAIAYTLDLIEGLEQVHALGVIHRDVKPSNAFLDADGRVKVGDFGLARSLQPEAKLTRTGTFVGTPLFAAPEQIKSEALDARADIYSVCATLYFLLTGKAPHDGKDGDSLAVLARVVSDDAPPVRSRRPDLPSGIERILARGLARDRERRYPDLASLCAELTAFRQTTAGWRLPAARFAAYFLDGALLSVFLFVVGFVRGRSPFFEPPDAAAQLSQFFLTLFYFWLCESLLGWTVGKWLLGLRVWRADDVGPAGLGAGFVRTATFLALISLPHLVLYLLFPPQMGTLGPATYLSAPLGIVGVAAILCTMRARNGYRCLHDLASGTRVVSAPERRPPVRYPSRPPRRELAPLPRPQRVGPFHVEGEVMRHGDECVLHALDPGLDRAVWLWLRPPDRPAIPAARRESFSGVRPRWLADGEQDGLRWDAFLVPAGAPLLDAVRATGKRPWEDARPILLDLAERLTEPPPEGVPPGGHSLTQVWLSPEGRVLLIDLPITRAADSPPPDLLADAATVLLEGAAPRAGQKSTPSGLLPGHARRVLEGLPRFGGTLDAAGFRDALVATADKPARLSRAARLLHLGLLALAQWVCGSGFLGLALLIGFGVFLKTDADIDSGRRVLADLDRYSATQAAALTAPSVQPASRLAPAYELHHLRRAQSQRVRLEQGIARFEPYRDARAARLSGAVREKMEEGKRQVRHPPRRVSAASLAWDADHHVKRLDRPFPAGGEVMLVAFGLLAVPLAVSVLSAFVFRGGIRYLILGIDVVRRDGRRAGRPRCAWRAFVAWLPVLGVIALARWVEESYWDRWPPEGGPAWLLLLADVCWVGAVAVPLACVVASIATPARAPHDRLAGTWLVPR